MAIYMWRENTVTETYTLSNTWTSSTDENFYSTNLYKSGYKIVEINFDWSTTCMASSSQPYCATGLYIQKWNSSNPSYMFWQGINYWSWNQAGVDRVRFESRYNTTTNTINHVIDASETNWSWTNTADLTFDNSGIQEVYNNNSHTRSLTNDETTIVNYLFNSSSVYLRMRATRTTNSFTVTVTYELS